MKTFAHFLRTLCTHIPIFTSQLEKSREATDAANLRVGYATASTQVLEGDKNISAGPVAMTQSTEGFASDIKDQKIGNVTLSSLTDAKKSVNYYVNVGTDGTMSITTSAAQGYTVVDPVTGKTASTPTQSGN